jgi:protein-tyrosine phosphatase
VSACEVVTNLWLGDLMDANAWGHARLNVLEGPVTYSTPHQHDTHIAILDLAKTPPAQPTWLDAAASHIGSYCIVGGNPLLVHCAAGIERSPLTIAWFLRKSGRFTTLNSAYSYLQGLRPVVADRREWLPEELR